MSGEPVDFESVLKARRQRDGKKGGGSRPKVDDVQLNHDSLALRFAGEHAGRCRYNWTSAQWHLWSGHHWEASETDGAVELVRGMLREVAAEKGLPKVVERLGTRGFATAVEGFARSDRRLAVRAVDFDPDPLLLATPGGHVDLRTGELRPARPESMAARACAVTPDEDDAGAERWHRFLREATGGDADMVRYLQQVAGYALTGSTAEQALFFVYGPGGNGKSVFVNTLRRIMGGYALHAPMETFSARGPGVGERHETELAMLAGARLVTAIETEEGRQFAEARIKALTGSDPITARFMRENYFTFTPKFKLLLVGNHKPGLRSVDEAISRRFRLLPFEQRPEEVNQALEAELEAEWPAILRWAIDGCLDWQADGMAAPEAVLRSTAEYLSDQDTIGRWLESQCEVVPPPYDPLDPKVPRTTLSALYANYQVWLEPQGEKPRSMKGLSQDLDKRGFPQHRTGSARWRIGLALRDDALRPLRDAGEVAR